MKIVCDVCGTTFPDTEASCPICGCAKAPNAQTVEDEVETTPEPVVAKTAERGGRYARGNAGRSSNSSSRNRRSSGRRSNEGSNKALVAVVIILLLAIVAVCIYIGVNLFSGDSNNDGGNNNQQVVNPSQNQNNQEIPCTGIQLGVKEHEFANDNDQLLLSVQLQPAETTDEVKFTSSDTDVAIVNKDGLITPGTKQGTAIITVTCGNIVDTCKIISTVGEPDVTEPTTPPGPVLPDGFVLKLKTYQDSGEITISGDATASIYSEIMGIKASEITWTSSDPSIATVENGKVTGVGKGYCMITASIGDQTATCKVICTSDAAPPSDYKISHVDVTIAVGETFNLSLKNKETGANVQNISWQVTQSGIVSISGNKITGQTVCWSGMEVYVEYEGVRYACRIIVKPAA